MTLWRGRRQRRRKRKQPDIAPGVLQDEAFLKAELFGLDQLEAYAKTLAKHHQVEVVPRRELMLLRLEENARTIRECHELITDSLKRGHRIDPAAEWLLDNYHLIQEQIELAESHLSPGYSRQLARLTAGPRKGLPRIYDVVMELVRHSDGQLDPDILLHFVRAYQTVQPLSLGELWAIPIMLRLSLIENLHWVAQRISWRRAQHDTALVWVERFLKVIESNPRQFVSTLGDFVREAPKLTSPFVAELVANIHGVNPAMGLALNWIEQELAEQGRSIEQIQQSENQAQSANHATTGNSITSMRTMAAIDWKAFVEELSVTEAVLRRDPAGVYPLMDFRTRNRYRTQVEKLARHADRAEEDVARAAISMAIEQRMRGADRLTTHVGHYLIGDGRRAFERQLECRVPVFRRMGRFLKRHPLKVYLLTATLLTALFSLPFYLLLSIGQAAWWGWILWGITTLALTRPALSIINWLLAVCVPPDSMPSLDFSKGIPDDQRTMVVVPTFLPAPPDIPRLLEDLEIRFLANQLHNLSFALLTDFPDADTETLPADPAWIEAAVQGIRELNQRHPTQDGAPRFALLHRPRLWNEAEGKWMGRERKRGKLEDFNRLIVEGDTRSFHVIEGDVAHIRSTRYVITLDTDTQLPPGTAAQLAGAMAHLLNRPHLNPATHLVESGYAILQPAIASTLASARQSLFSRLLAGEVGVDPYTREISNVYQDFFSRGQFIGKGIYDVHAFHAATHNRFPDNRILSHDLIEGCHARCGHLGHVELIESEPSRYLVDVNRRHRWTRGDWQIAAWLLPRVPAPNRTTAPNPLDNLSRWMIFDNLRRSLLPLLWLIALCGAPLILPVMSAYWISVLLLLFALPMLLRITRAMLYKGKHVPLGTHLRKTGSGEARGSTLDLLELIFAPHHALAFSDAILRVLVRLRTQRHLLEWQTASHTEKTARNSLPRTLLNMSGASLLGIASILAPLLLYGLCPPVLWVIGGAWTLSPLAAWIISRSRPPRGDTLQDAQRLYLRKIARRTWAYFDHFTTADTHWLPPDNFQEDLAHVAPRTSPTNIGMGVIGALSAQDFGYLSGRELIARTRRTFATLEKMERYRGHFYNWYNTQTLEPLRPAYISTVDSTNMSGLLLVMRAGLHEQHDAPILPARWREGLRDTLAILRAEIQAATRQRQLKAALAREIKRAIRKRLQQLQPPPGTPAQLPDILQLLRDAEAEAAAWTDLLANAPEAAFWLQAYQRQIADFLTELNELTPWAESNFANLAAPTREQLGAIPSLGAIATFHQRFEQLIPDGTPGRSTWKRLLNRASQTAGRRLEQLETLREQCAEFADHDFDFLYDSQRHLLAIGYNLETHKRDPGYYDLLASECRLGSFLGIARGQLPVEHWFHLGRRLAPGRGAPVLASWSGSMFEYLMPMLVMPSYEGTLLHTSNRESIRRQIAYGRKIGVPWGISESGYNQVDTHQIFQYRPFGVPALGMKRGLAQDRVIAPYATTLALMLAPRQALHNLRRLDDAGALGRYGFYEAIDYTSSRLPAGTTHALIPSWMAHHSGMSLLAISHLLHQQPMPRRFASDPHFRSFLLLLQERIPLSRPRAATGAAAETESERSDAPQAVTRVFTTPHTPLPEVHLLTNSHYHVMVTNSGAGTSRFEKLSLTRWREDAVQDAHGFFFYLHECDTPRHWSPTHQPLAPKFDRHEAVFSQGRAEFNSAIHQFQHRLQIAVYPEDNLELRQLTLTNLARRARTIELTTYAEIVLMDPRGDAAHPAFQKLFVQPHPQTDQASLLFTRRPRSSTETHPWLFHTLLVEGGITLRGPTHETDRAQFIGRRRTLQNPAALDAPGPLPNREGFVLDPCAAIRYRIRLNPGETIRVNAFLGIAPDRPAAEAAINRCHDPRIPERIFSLAWTRSQILLHQLRVSEADVQTFARLTNSLLYASAHRRDRATAIAANTRNQAALWSYGISGDLPIILLSITDPTNLDLVRSLVQAHTYWRNKGLDTDLVIWSEAYAGYRQNLLDAIIGLVQAGTEGKLLDQPGGIFVRNIDQVPEPDRLLFRATARLVFSDRYGTLADQIDRRVLRLPDRAKLPPRPAPAKTPPAPPLPFRQLDFFNGIGGFTPDGREYVIQLPPGATTPAPWVNVLANPHFGTVISESGSAYTWALNAHQLRLTPWHNDPVTDPSGETLYIRDDETGRIWSPFPQPSIPANSANHTPPAPAVCRHGHGYTVFERTHDGIESETTIHVHHTAPLKFTTLRLRNTTDRPRRISTTAYVEWVLGEHRDPNAMHIVTRLDPQSGAIFAQNPFSLDFPEHIAFLHCSAPERTLTADRFEFIGRNGTLADPDALRHQTLSNRVGAALDPCAAILAPFTIPPHDEIHVTYILGAAPTEDQAREHLRRHAGLTGARQSLEEIWEFWQRQLGGIYVETPDPALNHLVNHWLLYQTLSSRLWGRTGYYQSGGAYGFRDQLQDSLAFLHECPWLTRQHLLTSAARQFTDGDVQHWWHPPVGRGVRTHITDDLLWLPYVTARYLHVTGDTGILDEPIPYLEARPLAPDEESNYDLPRTSDHIAPLYDHCVRAIRRATEKTGAHGLPLIGGGDWNDGMNRVGHQGRGESVWLAFFIRRVCLDFHPIAQDRGDHATAQHCATLADQLAHAADQHAWDGNWYRRAYFDDGTPLGSHQSPECQIDLLPQSWSVISDAPDTQRARTAMNSAHERLYDPQHQLTRLFTPPFHTAPWDPGYIKGYLPGVRENGAQYTHAAVWFAIATALQRDTPNAWKLAHALNPIHHTTTPDALQTYQREPYVIAADIYTAPGHQGQGGWSWYTGAAAWLYQYYVEHLLGIRLRVNQLTITPLLPPDWKDLNITYRYRNTFYHIHLTVHGPRTWNPRRVLVNGIEQPDKTIHLTDDGHPRQVHIQLG